MRVRAAVALSLLAACGASGPSSPDAAPAATSAVGTYCAAAVACHYRNAWVAVDEKPGDRASLLDTCGRALAADINTARWECRASSAVCTFVTNIAWPSGVWDLTWDAGCP